MTDAEPHWERIGSKEIHRTPFLCLREDEVRLPTGQVIHYGVVECGHCVGVLPFVDSDNVVLVRQFRYIVDEYTWEMPTGGVSTGEAPEAAARRECMEEAGYRPSRLIPLGFYHTSKSSIDETAHLFIGEGLEVAHAAADDIEDTRPRVFPFTEVLQMVLDGRITDSMTIIAVLRAARIRSKLDHAS